MTQDQSKSKRGNIPFCEEKRRLMKDFVDCSHDFMELQNQQTQAVIDEDTEFARFDDLIHMARGKKDRAKYALIAHMEEHCC
jgi:hypothetical protein